MVKQTQDSVQTSAREAFKANNYWGLVAMATGTGKSKIGVDETADVVGENTDALVIISVPTRKLRDNNWLEEFIKWGKEDIYHSNVQRYCYASINKITGKRISLLVLDEGHNITELNSKVFLNNKVERLLVLTATPPEQSNDTDKAKLEIFKRLKVNTIFHYSLDEAVKHGLVAPYEIRVVECTLDNTTKYIKAGTKAKPFFQTEMQRYEYLSKTIKTMMMTGSTQLTWKLLDRMRLIQNLKSKTEIVRRVMQRWLEPGDRYLIFCGSIEQSKILCGEAVYNSKTKDTALEAFKRLELDVLGVVDALNEGHNIPEVDGAMVAQLNSKGKDLVQRIGRAIRARRDKPGHKAVIWLFVVLNTVDEEWFKKAIETFDKSRIVYLHYKNVI